MLWSLQNCKLIYTKIKTCWKEGTVMGCGELKRNFCFYCTLWMSRLDVLWMSVWMSIWMSRLNVIMNVNMNVVCQGQGGEGDAAIAPYSDRFRLSWLPSPPLPLSRTALAVQDTSPTPSPPKGLQLNDGDVRVFYSFSRVRGFGSYSPVWGITVKEMDEKLIRSFLVFGE
jgi:hypothetical protein